MRGQALTAEDREEISRGISEGFSGSAIARLLGKHRSVVNREISRCGGRESYRALAAQERAEEQALRPKPHKLAVSERLHDAVAEGLKQSWSPAQISSRLKVNHPDDPEMRGSGETIYETLYLQSRGGCDRPNRPHRDGHIWPHLADPLTG
ncbi:helix-turn-helix domain-containing protein [Frankia sp. Cas4]|uniref:helix-turn-helix domain-containing protein n=1 Tax=Frankia sp. Cas4 TaxID=3073927 RepID=UPI002AD29B17|nr:helix-turn-helix domain-containing protein [Frankia sp. Cas4]